MNPFADLPCLSAHDGGSELRVQVVPNAGHTAVAGLLGDALRVRLAAPPVEGRANAVLQQWLAKSLGLPRRGVRLIGGEMARRKRLHLDCPSQQVADWLRAQLAVNSES
ncbi:MAG: DUF167 domain-containing protein [Rubrivivax sp.]